MKNKIGKYKFLTNIYTRDIEHSKKVADLANKELGIKAISVSRLTQDKEDTGGSIWYCCDHEQLQTYHRICRENEIPFNSN